MKTEFVCVSLAALAMGCGMHPRNEFRVEIDPAFTVSQQADVVEGLQDWEDAVSPSPLAFNIWEGDEVCGTEGKDCDGVITVHPSTVQAIHDMDPGGDADPLGITSWRWKTGLQGEEYWADIYLVPKDDSDTNEKDVIDWQEAVQHEIGHALSLEHTGPGTIMCAFNSCAAMRITPADVAQFRHLRGE